MRKHPLRAAHGPLAPSKLWSLGFALGTFAVLAALSLPAEAKRGKKAPETYSAYDPTQDPAADQSSTFNEPVYLESLGPPAPAPRPARAAKALPAAVKPAPSAKRVTQLPSTVKAPPKVVAKKLPEIAVAPAAATKPAPAPATPAAPDLSSLHGAVESARFSSPPSPRLMPLKEYQTQSCEAWRGIKDYELADRSRADCVTMRYTFAFAYADEWEEAAARALRHSRQSGLPAAVALIVEREEDLSFVEALARFRAKRSLRLEIKKVMLPEVSRALSR